jgi:hypothetical protein
MQVRWWHPVLFSALAGGMAWGIRGQYGHETGAMIAGLLVSLTLVYLLCRDTDWHSRFRAVAWTTVAMGFGGTMTYGETLGLTQNAPLIGNDAAWRWGMLGVAVKGGMWIGLAGLFLGMGLGGKRYRPGEIGMLMLAMVGAFFMGLMLLNMPHNPVGGELPHFYFSAHWHWQPDATDLEHRREWWGGLLGAWLVATLYASVGRGDKLARRMALWGLLGGALGFPAGQFLQSYHAWNPEVFDQGIWTNLDPYMNWWNMMEMTFGAVMGGVLGFGLWRNRHHIHPHELEVRDRFSVPAEFLLLFVHLPMLIAVEFVAIRWVDSLYDYGIIMGIIPMIGIAGGRLWPYLQILPLTLLPIAGKTAEGLVSNEAIGGFGVWFLYFVVPMTLSIVAVIYLRTRVYRDVVRGDLVSRTLMFTGWLYFLLNWAYFRYPWPWSDWTGRTPSGIIMTVCILGLTLMVWWGMYSKRKNSEALAE